MTKPDPVTEEFSRQGSVTWERGKFFRSYEKMLGDYMVKAALEHTQPPSLLDVACGNGLLTNALAPRFSRIVGLDASVVHVTTARHTYPGIEFVHALGEDYEAQEPFSTITLFNLLEHVVDPPTLLSQVARNLAPAGVMFMTVPNAMAINRRIAKLMGTLADDYELSPFDIEIAGHRRSYDLPLLLRHVEASGLRIAATGGIFYKMLSQAQINWLLEKGPWEEGGFGWGRVGAEKAKDWRQAFCDACYEIGKERPEDCNLVYAVAVR